MNELNSITEFLNGAIGAVSIAGFVVLAVTIIVIVAILDIKTNTARTQKELNEIKQQMNFIVQSLEYQNKVISQIIKPGGQNTSSGTSSTWENNYYR
mgnify:CR=1 FL=1